MSIKTVNDWGICDNGGCEAFHLTPYQLIDLCQVLQHYNNASDRDAYDKEPDKEDGAQLYFSPDWKSSTNDDRKWDAHQQYIRGDVRAAHRNHSIRGRGTVWSLKQSG